jgi:hypothetical protein
VPSMKFETVSENDITQGVVRPDGPIGQHGGDGQRIHELIVHIDARLLQWVVSGGIVLKEHFDWRPDVTSIGWKFFQNISEVIVVANRKGGVGNWRTGRHAASQGDGIRRRVRCGGLESAVSLIRADARIRLRARSGRGSPVVRLIFDTFV